LHEFGHEAWDTILLCLSVAILNQDVFSLNDEQIIEKLTSCLFGKDLSSETIEAVLATYRSADPTGRRELFQAVFGLTNVTDPTDKEVKALLNGLFPAFEKGQTKV